jgi:hypothetical protein
MLGDQFLAPTRYIICGPSLTSAYIDEGTDSFSELVGTHETDCVSIDGE